MDPLSSVAAVLRDAREPDASADSRFGGPIARYYAFEATQAAAFTLPIFVVYFQSRGLGLAEVGVVEAVYTVVATLAEGPTGYLGDRLGRRRTLVASAALAGGGAVGFVFAHSLGAFLAVVVVRAVAGALRSGTGEAWLYETLAATESHDRERFAAYRGRASAVGRVTTALSVLAGGALYAASPTAPWVLEGSVVAVGGLLALSLPEPPAVEGDAVTSGEGRPLRTALRTLSRPRLRRFVAFTAVVLSVPAGVHVLLQPAAVELAGVPTAHLGGLYFALLVVAALAADRAEWIRRRVGTDGWFLLAPAAVGGLLVAVLASPALVLVAFVGVRVLGAVSKPLVSKYVNDRAGADARASTLSGAAMLRSLLIAPTKLAVGAVAAGSLAVGVAGLGGVLLLAVGVATALGGPTGEVPVRDPTGTVDR